MALCTYSSFVCVARSDHQRIIEKMVDERIKAMNADVQVGFKVLLSCFPSLVLGAIQVLRNADGGGGVRFSGKSVTKV